MRRRFLLALPLVLGGCSVIQTSVERRQWPLLVPRPQSLPPRARDPVLQVRSLVAGSGLEMRGLHALQPDGSMNVNFYEEWAAPAADSVTEALRLWLSNSGKFAAVVGTGTGVQADLELSGTLAALWSVPASHVGRAGVVVTLLDQRPATPKVIFQRSFTADAPLPGETIPDAVAAQVAALAEVFRQIEAAMP